MIKQRSLSFIKMHPKLFVLVLNEKVIFLIWPDFFFQKKFENTFLQRVYSVLFIYSDYKSTKRVAQECYAISTTWTKLDIEFVEVSLCFSSSEDGCCCKVQQPFMHHRTVDGSLNSQQHQQLTAKEKKKKIAPSLPGKLICRVDIRWLTHSPLGFYETERKWLSKPMESISLYFLYCES